MERLSIAEVWRATGLEADARGLSRPGYHTVRALVLDERERRGARREALSDAVAELWAYTGTDVPKLLERLNATRRPRPGR